MADVIYKKGQSSNLDNVQIKEGQILVTEDTGEMYIDVTDNDRKKINAIADQAYAPTSENAQSGKAVAEAVANEQKRSDNTFANALKGSKSGSAILIDDISPVTNEMTVKVSSDTVEDLTAVKISRYGKNLFDASKVQNATLTTFMNKPCLSYVDGANYFVYTSNFKEDTQYTFTTKFYREEGYINKPINLSLWYTDGTSHAQIIYPGKIVSITSQQGKTLTKISGDDNYRRKCYIDLSVTQLEIGTSATEYEPYIEPTDYTPNADGTVNGVTSLYPNTTLMTDTDGVIITCEYNKDINKFSGVDVNQSYDPTSENAQSGKAVKEALNTAAAIIPGEGTNSIKQNYPGTLASGDSSASIGVNVETSSDNSVGIGRELITHGDNGVNIGYQSELYNQDGVSFGRDNRNYSHVGITAGYKNIAGLPEYADKQWGYDIARGAIAMGWENHATHACTCILGFHNNSSRDDQTVFGRFCADDTNALFILGNGKDVDNRSNLYTVDKDGNGCFKGSVYVGSSKKDGAGSKRLATEEYIDKKIEVSDTAPTEEENKIWLKPITDSSEYIIEEGTNGIWTYRIWSSGISECWGKQSISVTTSTSNNGYYTGSVGSLEYPSNLFISEPVLNCTLKASSFPGHLFIDGTESSSYTGKISIAAHSNTTVNGYIHLSAKGRWK